MSDVTWEPGRLLPYESIASIGVHYMRLNCVSATQFMEFLRDFFPHREGEGPSLIDAPEFNLKGFARALGEPLGVVRNLSANELHFLPKHGGAFELCAAGESNWLHYCPVCCGQGFHSNLHQLEWVERCFLHGEPLMSLARRRGEYFHLPRDVGLLFPLLEVKGFRSASRTISAAEVGVASARLLRSARRVKEAFASIDRDASPQAIARSPAAAISSALGLCAIPRAMAPSNIRRAPLEYRTYFAPRAPDVWEGMSKFGRLFYPCLHALALHSICADARADWMERVRMEIAHLRALHASCFASLGDFLDKPIKGREVHARVLNSGSPAIELARYCYDTCSACVAVELLGTVLEPGFWAGAPLAHGLWRTHELHYPMFLHAPETDLPLAWQPLRLMEQVVKKNASLSFSSMRSHFNGECLIPVGVAGRAMNVLLDRWAEAAIGTVKTMLMGSTDFVGTGGRWTSRNWLLPPPSGLEVDIALATGEDGFRSSCSGPSSAFAPWPVSTIEHETKSRAFIASVEEAEVLWECELRAALALLRK